MNPRRRASRFTALALAGLLLAGLSGCQKDADIIADPVASKEMAALTELAEVYRAYSITKGRPPANLEELSVPHAMGPNGVAAVKSGDIVVQYGAVLPSTDEEPGKVSAPEILAYPKDAPEKGGVVLLLDRTTRKMTADEFKAAPKAVAKSGA